MSVRDRDVPKAQPGEQEPLSFGFPGCLYTQTCWRRVGVLPPPRCPPPPSFDAPQGWTSQPTKTRRATRRPTSWRSTRTPRNAPSGPTLGSTGPSPPTGASSPPPPQSESPVPGSSGPCLRTSWTPLCLQGEFKGDFPALALTPKRFPAKAANPPESRGHGLPPMMLGKPPKPCNPPWLAGAVEMLHPAVQPFAR